MKSTETIAARGRAAAQEIFDSANSEDLDRIMDLGLPASTFTALAARALLREIEQPLFRCNRSSSVRGLSGLTPQLFVDGSLSEVDQIAAVIEGTFELSRAIYLGAVRGADQSDLDSWIAGGLHSDVRLVAAGFVSAYGDDRSMLKIGSNEAPRGLGSFNALRRLVLKDG